CTSDSACSASQKCSGNKCVAVSCSGTCMTVSNHACVKKSGCCTSNSDCSGAQTCSGGKCVAVSCKPVCWYAENHTCVTARWYKVKPRGAACSDGCECSSGSCSGGSICN
ncbi:MAG: hypothetical protein ACI4PW_05500, partial [Alphaproteobacteria bacterium]